MDYKICTKCGKRFEAITNFFYKGKGEFGLRADCKVCNNKYQKQYRANNTKRAREYGRQWHIDNPDYDRQYQDYRNKCTKKWYANNFEHVKKYSKQWSKDNADKVNAKAAKRRAIKLNQTPSDANMVLIQFYYTVSATLADYVVEHYQPLNKGGLHHENNLQLLEKGLNLQKRDKWPLTPEEEIKYKGYKL
jgi:hypothetical protein